MKWILQYNLKIIDVGLLFEQSDSLGQGIIEYVDSNYVGDLNKIHLVKLWLGMLILTIPMIWINDGRPLNIDLLLLGSQ